MKTFKTKLYYLLLFKILPFSCFDSSQYINAVKSRYSDFREEEKNQKWVS